MGVAVCGAGHDLRPYPWGNNWDAAAVPAPGSGQGDPQSGCRRCHPGGVSPFGVMDMVGNVWQWTEEFVDEHTRGGLLRGGSYSSAARFDLVFSSGVPERPAWEAAAHGPKQGPSRGFRISLRHGRGVIVLDEMSATFIVSECRVG